jgi:hypothetical protein
VLFRRLAHDRFVDRGVEGFAVGEYGGQALSPEDEDELIQGGRNTLPDVSFGLQGAF